MQAVWSLRPGNGEWLPWHFRFPFMDASEPSHFPPQEPCLPACIDKHCIALINTALGCIDKTRRRESLIRALPVPILDIRALTDCGASHDHQIPFPLTGKRFHNRKYEATGIIQRREHLLDASLPALSNRKLHI